MKLLNLKLINFKGIKSFELAINGESVSIFGKNGSGKTTLADSISYLLFDKDTANKKDFGIKTLDADGVVIPAINHEVEATFSISGEVVTLKKTYYEYYPKKRGAAEREFDGHKTDYEINGVPKPKKDFDKYISGIISEDIFKLLTSPDYFNTQLHWKDRRKTLLAICGDISDRDVIDSDKTLKELTAIVGNRSMEDHKLVIAARRKKINEQLEKIPGLINENNLMLPDVTGLDQELIAATINALRNQKTSKEQEISRIQNGGEVAEQQKLLAEIDSKLADIRTKFKIDNADKSFAKKQELQGMQLKLSKFEQDIKFANGFIESANRTISDYEKKQVALRESWKEVVGRKFEVSINDSCPTCLQSLPADQVENAKSKALAAFNLKNSTDKENIDKSGKSNKEFIKNKQSEIDEHNSLVAKWNQEKNHLQLSISALESEINGSSVPVARLEDDPDNIQVFSEKMAIHSKINEIKEKSQSVIDSLKVDIQNIESAIRDNETDLLKFGQVEQGNKRIQELLDQEKALAAEFEKLESELFLVDSFTRTKVSLLEKNINSKFKIARFKMFNVQVNQGIDECCDTLGANGVPYGSGLNQAARINVGIDICNTLAEHYKFCPFLFIDNKESVSELIETNSQIISLIVSPNDNTLRVEL